MMASIDIDKVRLEDLEEIEKVLLELSPTNESKRRDKEEAMTVDMDDEEEPEQELQEDEDDCVILEANIYKYHGADEVSSLDQQVSEGILKFQYRDEDDEDIIEVNVIGKENANTSLDLITIDDDEDNDPDEIVEDEENKEQVLTCEDSGTDVLEDQLEDKKLGKHKITKRRFKTFENGNFFMLAD